MGELGKGKQEVGAKWMYTEKDIREELGELVHELRNGEEVVGGGVLERKEER